MKPYTCLSTRMDVAALLTAGYSPCRRSRRLAYKCCKAVPSSSSPPHRPLVWRQRCRLPHACFFIFFLNSGPGTLQAHKCYSPPLYQELLRSRNGPVPLAVSVFEWNWLMSRLPEQNGLCYFHSATAWRELLLVGPMRSHGNSSASRENIADQASYWSMLAGKLLIDLYLYRKNIPFSNLY